MFDLYQIYILTRRRGANIGFTALTRPRRGANTAHTQMGGTYLLVMLVPLPVTLTRFGAPPPAGGRFVTTLVPERVSRVRRSPAPPPHPLGDPPTRPLGTCGARWNRPASPSSTFRPSPTKAQGANGGPHAGPYCVPCLAPYTPPQPPGLIGTFDPMSATCNGQVSPPKNMVKMGETARGKTFPHPLSAFHLPAPPHPAVAQLTSSWGKGAPPLVAPPEAQGAQGARPEAPPFCRSRCRCSPTSAPAAR